MGIFHHPETKIFTELKKKKQGYRNRKTYLRMCNGKRNVLNILRSVWIVPDRNSLVLLQDSRKKYSRKTESNVYTNLYYYLYIWMKKR